MMSEETTKMLQYIKIADPQALGRLIAEYSIGYRLKRDGTRPAPDEREDVIAPGDGELDKFKADLARHAAGTVRNRVTGLKVIHGEPDTFVMVLPPKSVVEMTIDEFAGQTPGETYQDNLEDFYEHMILVGRPWPNPEGMQHLPFWYCRVADYTVSLCG